MISSMENPATFRIRREILLPLLVILLYMDKPLQAVLSCMTVFLIDNHDRLTARHFCRNIFTVIAHIFFRQIETRGSAYVPRKGPTIFVCAPHANQFLDPILAIEGVPRNVNFLAAAKSCRHKVYGPWIKVMGSIGVERPQDVAVLGQGSIKTIEGDGIIVKGDGTKFTEQCMVRGSLMLGGEIIPIKTVVSDTEIELKSKLMKTAIARVEKQNGRYKCVPKIDQSQVFAEVVEKLSRGGAIGIFPEGGSHDRTELLEFKAGVAYMALSALEKYPEMSLKIVPVGLNYFSGHRFRSAAYVDYGEAFEVDSDLVAQYQKGGDEKYTACDKLLAEIEARMASVTVSASSFDVLQVFWAMRRLYIPKDRQLTTGAKLELTRRLEEGYEKFKDMPEVKVLHADVLRYNARLKAYGIRDHQVKVVKRIDRCVALRRLLWRLCLLIGFIIFALPGFVLNAPIAIFARIVSRSKAKSAVANSNVKVAGRDVMGTWKVLTAMAIVPICFIIYPSIAIFIGYKSHRGAFHTWLYFASIQPFVMYGSLRFVEQSVSIVKSLPPLMMCIFDPSRGEKLHQEREELSKRVRTLIETLGPMMYGQEEFDRKRLIPKSAFKSPKGGERKKSQ